MELALLETAPFQTLYNQQRHFPLSPPFLATKETLGILFPGIQISDGWAQVAETHLLPQEVASTLGVLTCGSRPIVGHSSAEWNCLW